MNKKSKILIGRLGGFGILGEKSISTYKDGTNMQVGDLVHINRYEHDTEDMHDDGEHIVIRENETGFIGIEGFLCHKTINGRLDFDERYWEFELIKKYDIMTKKDYSKKHCKIEKRDNKDLYPLRKIVTVNGIEFIVHRDLADTIIKKLNKDCLNYL